MTKLRPYQTQANYWLNRQLNQGNNPLLVMPTGTGKTKTAIKLIADRISLKKRIIVLVPEVEIFEQWIKECSENNLNYGYINDEGVIGRGKDVYICMALSLDNLLISLPEKFCNSIKEIITDETHQSNAQTWVNIYNHFDHAQRIGLTATPYRMDNKPLSDFYDTMFEAITMNEAIEKGYICKPVIIVPEEYKNNIPDFNDINIDAQKQFIQEKKIIGDMIKTYKDVFNGLPVIIPCSSHKHAEFVTELYINAGWQVDHIHSKMNKWERKSIINRIKKDETNILVTVGVGAKGLDIPGLYGIIWLRFTESLTIYMQFNGRAMRTMTGKKYFIMIDPVGNSVIHGRPDIDRNWSLKTDYTPGQDIPESPESRICVVCGVSNSIDNNKCWICGYDFETKLDKDGNLVEGRKRRLPKMIDGELVYLDKNFEGVEDGIRRQENNVNDSNVANSNNSNGSNKQDVESVGLTKLQKVEILSRDLTGLKVKNKFKEGLKWL